MSGGRRVISPEWGRVRLGVALGLLLALATALPAVGSVDVNTGTTRRVTPGAGSESNQRSESPFVSADGRFVFFWSWATNLVPGGNQPGLFWADLTASDIHRVDDPNCRPFTEATCQPFGISGHGRYLLVLVTEPDRRGTWLLVHDRTSGRSHEVTVALDGQRTLSNIGNASMSADGRYVAFGSDSNELVEPHDHNTTSSQVYVRDMVAGTTRQISLNVNGSQPWGGSSVGGAISGDGSTVMFGSSAHDLVADAPNDPRYYTYAHDLRSGVTTMLNREVGDTGDTGLIFGGMSFDGRHVGLSRSGGDSGVFLFDRSTKAMHRASVGRDGTPARGDFGPPAVAERGDAVLFEARSEDLLDTPDRWPDHFIHRFDSGETVLVETPVSGTQPNSFHAGATIDSDAGVVVFSTDSSNIVDGDHNQIYDVFVRRYVGDTPATLAATEVIYPRPGTSPTSTTTAPATTAPSTTTTVPAPRESSPDQPGSSTSTDVDDFRSAITVPTDRHPPSDLSVGEAGRSSPVDRLERAFAEAVEAGDYEKADEILALLRPQVSPRSIAELEALLPDQPHGDSTSVPAMFASTLILGTLISHMRLRRRTPHSSTP